MSELMNRANTQAQNQAVLPREFIDLDALGAVSVERAPFPYFIVPRFVKTEALDAIRALRGDGASGTVADYPALSAWLTRMEENFAPVADWLD